MRKSLTLFAIALVTVFLAAGCESQPPSPPAENNTPDESKETAQLTIIRERPEKGDSFAVSELKAAKRIEFTNIVGKTRALAEKRRDALLNVLGEAEFESATFPERDTGGGIVGRLTFTFEDGSALVELHDDFLWVDGYAFFLATDKVEALQALFE